MTRGKNGCRVNYRLSCVCRAESTVREGVRAAKSIDATGKYGLRATSSVRDTCGPIPGTLRSRSSFSRHRGLRCILLRRSVSRSSSSCCSQLICASIRGRTYAVARPRRFFSATRMSDTCRLRASTCASSRSGLSQLTGGLGKVAYLSGIDDCHRQR